MARKPTYEELEQRVKELEKEAAERKHLEEELRIKDCAIASSINAIGFADLEGNVTYVNDSFLKIWGYDEKEVLGKPAVKLWQTEEKAAEAVDALRAGRNWMGGLVAKRKDGSLFDVHLSASMVTREDGKPVCMMGSFLDVTERKRAEEALRESEWKYKELADSLPETVFVVDGRGNLTFANHSSFEAFGYTQEDFDKGLNALQMLSPQDEERAKHNMLRVLSGEKLGGNEYTARRKDGSTFPVIIHSTPIIREGKPEGLTGIIVDISERKRAEGEIRKLSSAVEQSIDGIAIADSEPKLTYVNDAFARMHGYCPEEMVGMKVVNLYNEEQMDEYNSGMHQVKTHGSWAGEIWHIRKDGTPFPTYMSVTLLKAENGIPTAILAVARDITGQKQAEEERKKLEAQLQQAQKMEAIGTLAGGIAHDFNNLLMAIQGNASLMLFDIDVNHPHYENVKKIEKQVRSGAELTRQLLGYARKGRYEVKPVSLNNLVEETSETFGRTRKEITIHRELAEDLFAIEADEGQIEQVLLNLYVNASDAMRGGGNLILKTMNVTHEDMGQKVYDVKPGKYVLLTVTDTGTGVDKETRERIFDPFFTTKEMGRGTGLGLASVYGIVKSHGGYIDVDSKKGRGTTFSIYLPASQKKVRKTIKPADKIIKGSGTILLVDDEEMVMDVGAIILQKLGYTVLEAKSGKEAVEVYKKNRDKINVVILDMIMPDTGGGEAYDKMKEINPDIMVLLTSGYSIDGQATQILERGCNGFIQKPFTMKKLSQTITEIRAKK